MSVHDCPMCKCRQSIVEHGTLAGYQRHINNKTETCRPCKDAKAAYDREYRARRKAEAALVASRVRMQNGL